MSGLKINEEFLDKYGDLISKYIWSMKLSGRDEYDDLYNDVVIKLIESKEKYDPKRSALSTWITWVMRTVVYNYFRHKQQDAIHNSTNLTEGWVHAAEDADDPMNQKDLVSIINRIEAVAEDDKVMLIEYYHLGYTHLEVAEARHMTENAVKTRIHRAKSKLSEDIQGELSD